MKNTIVASLVALMGLSQAYAAGLDDVRLGRPAYGGSGCPRGSASVALSPDRKSLSLLFDEFVVEAGGDTRKRTARKTCNVAVPVHVPQGFSVSLIKIDYRGFNALPSGAYSRFSVEYFFAGSRGPRYTKTFRGRLERDYTLTNTLAAHAVSWSRCGSDVNLRANTSMMVRTNSRSQEAMSTVDSMDVRAGLVYHLQWKRCR